MFKKLLKIFSLSCLIVMLGCAANAPQIKSIEPIPLDVVVDVMVNDEECAYLDNEVKGSQPEMSQLSWIMDGEGYVKIFSGLSVSDVTRTWTDLKIMKHAGIKIVNVFLNSPGGGAFDGIALARTLSKAAKDGMLIKIEASGIVASAAIPVLAVGCERRAVPGTIFMVHEAALWKWPGRETASDIRSQNELMTMLRNSYMDILVEFTGTKRDVWEEMEGRTTWFDVKKAKKLNLID